MRIYRDGRVWYADLRSLGKGRRSTRCTDRRAAERVARRWEREAADPDHATSDVTLGQALTHLVEHGCADLSPATVALYERKAGHLVRILGHDIPLGALRRDDVQAYVAQRRRERARRTTIRKELIPLRRALKEASAQGWWSGSVDQLVPRVSDDYRPRDRWLTHGEYLALRTALPTHRRLWLDVAVYTGARFGELEALRWEHVDLDGGRILLPGTKTARARRWVPIPDALDTSLREAERDRGRVLPSWRCNCRRDLRAACERAGIEPVSPNDLRRTYGSWLVQAGAPLSAVAQLMGHTSTQMVDRVYGHLAAEHLERAVSGLPNICQTPADSSDVVGLDGRTEEAPIPPNRAKPGPT